MKHDFIDPKEELMSIRKEYYKISLETEELLELFKAINKWKIFKTFFQKAE
jgi:hypothetical protein